VAKVMVTQPTNTTRIFNDLQIEGKQLTKQRERLTDDNNNVKKSKEVLTWW
jgi:hypothetical protein